MEIINNTGPSMDPLGDSNQHGLPMADGKSMLIEELHI
jgi:hypothetical protein